MAATGSSKARAVAKSEGAKSGAVGKTARLRRERVLKPVKRDQFLADVSARKTLGRRRRTLSCQTRRRQVPSEPDAELDVEEQEQEQEGVQEQEQHQANQCSCGREEHEDLSNLPDGAIKNALYAQRLPERLLRPKFADNPAEILSRAGYDPVVELNGLKIAREELSKHGKQLFSAMTSTIAHPFNAYDTASMPAFVIIGIPKTMRVEHLPTHVLALANKDPKLNTGLSLVPIHAQVIATQCGRVPPMPTPNIPDAAVSLQPLDQEHYHTRIVPLVPMQVPSVDTFSLLFKFLCEQDVGHLFRRFIPLGPPGGGMWDGDFSRLAETLANERTGASILSGALFIYRFWQNACSLGVLNPAVWNVIDVVWKAHRNALLLAQR